MNEEYKREEGENFGEGTLNSFHTDTIQAPGATSDLTIAEGLSSAVTVLSAIAASVAVMALIVAGIMWSVAAGDEDKIDTAKKYIKWSIFGLILSTIAWSITGFFMSQFGTN
jgi:hypothetical protein